MPTCVDSLSGSYPTQAECVGDCKDKKYTCSNGTCIESPSGKYDTLDECNDNCTFDKWACLSDFTCAKAATGYDNEQQCLDSCKADKYICDNGDCLLDDNGTFDTLAECVLDCDKKIYGYECESSVCTAKYDAGTYTYDTYSACTSAGCGNYECVNGSCVPQVGGTYTSQGACDDQSNCGKLYECVSGTCKQTTAGTLTLDECNSACGDKYLCTGTGCVISVNGTQSKADCEAACKFKCTPGVGIESCSDPNASGCDSYANISSSNCLKWTCQTGSGCSQGQQNLPAGSTSYDTESECTSNCKGWDCVGNRCNEVAGGKYATKSDCLGACPDKYFCVGDTVCTSAQSVSDDVYEAIKNSPSYSDSAECDKFCGKKTVCDGTTCIPLPDGASVDDYDGEYDSLDECLGSNCSEKYICAGNGECYKNPYGTWDTKDECADDCSFQADWYKCELVDNNNYQCVKKSVSEEGLNFQTDEELLANGYYKEFADCMADMCTAANCVNGECVPAPQDGEYMDIQHCKDSGECQPCGPGVPGCERCEYCGTAAVRGDISAEHQYEELGFDVSNEKLSLAYGCCFLKDDERRERFDCDNPEDGADPFFTFAEDCANVDWAKVIAEENDGKTPFCGDCDIGDYLVVTRNTCNLLEHVTSIANDFVTTTGEMFLWEDLVQEVNDTRGVSASIRSYDTYNTWFGTGKTYLALKAMSNAAQVNATNESYLMFQPEFDELVLHTGMYSLPDGNINWLTEKFSL